VIDQIAESIQANAGRTGQRIVVRLHPPELGKVRLTLHQEGDEIRGILEVNDSRTLEEIQREAPALIQRLADSGVQLRRLDVNLTDQSPGDGANSTLRDSHQGSADGSNERSAPPAPEDARPDEAAAEDPDGVHGPALTDDQSVNVWR